MGIPIIITKDISDDSELIEKHNVGVVWESFDDEAYIELISRIDKLIKSPEISDRARTIAEIEKTFELAKKEYDELYA